MQRLVCKLGVVLIDCNDLVTWQGLSCAAFDAGKHPV